MNGPQIMIPQQQAERPRGSGASKTQPKGAWEGSIDEVRERSFPDWVDPVGRPKSGYASTDGEILSLQFGDQVPLESQEDYGKGKLFVDLVIRDGDTTLETVNVSDRNSKSWKLQEGARMLVNLAIALGQTETVDTDDGPMTAIREGFLDALRSGEYTGQRVGYIIYHGKPYEGKDGEQRADVKVQTFTPAI